MQTEHVSMAELADQLRAELTANRTRRVIGIAGAPGAGKSTVNAFLAEALGPELAVIAPMDGFHLANEVLEDLGRRDRKGAPDTFDAAGFAALLARIAAQRPGDPVIYAPRFHRDIEEPIANAIPIPGDVPLVLTEGNYLLLDSGDWPLARRQVGEVWFVTVADEVRHQRLIRRRLSYGNTREQAEHWTFGSDEANAQVVQTTRTFADRLLAIAHVDGLDART